MSLKELSTPDLLAFCENIWNAILRAEASDETPGKDGRLVGKSAAVFFAHTGLIFFRELKSRGIPTPMDEFLDKHQGV